MRDAAAVDAAHVAGGAGGHKHVARGQMVRRRGQVQQVALRGEHHAMLRFGVNFQLRMVRAKMALAAGAGQAREFHRRRVPRVAGRAIADGAVFVWFADTVATVTAALGGRAAFEPGQRMRRTLHAAGLVLFGKGDLFRREIRVAGHRRPSCRRVPAVEELLIDGFVTGPAIGRRQLRANDKTVVIRSRLPLRHLMAIQAGDALCGVFAHLEFVDDGILEITVTLGAFAAGAHKRGARLFNDQAWTF